MQAAVSCSCQSAQFRLSVESARCGSSTQPFGLWRMQLLRSCSRACQAQLDSTQLTARSSQVTGAQMHKLTED